MWCDINSIWLAKQIYSAYMAAIVSIISRYGLRIEVCHRNLIRVSYSYISYSFHFNNSLKQLYISNKMEQLS